MQQNKPSHLETFLSELKVLRLIEKKILIAAIFDIS